VTVDKARHATGCDSEINRDLFAEWGRGAGGEQGEVQEKKRAPEGPVLLCYLEK